MRLKEQFKKRLEEKKYNLELIKPHHKNGSSCSRIKRRTKEEIPSFYCLLALCPPHVFYALDYFVLSFQYIYRSSGRKDDFCDFQSCF